MLESRNVLRPNGCEDTKIRLACHGVIKVFLDVLQQHGAAVGVDCIDFGFFNEVDELVCSILADKCINRFVFREHDGLEVHVHLVGELQVPLDLEFLVTAVFFAAQDDRKCFCSAGLQLVQVVDVQFLEHRGDNAWNTGEVSGEGVKESLYDNRIFAIRLDVKRNGGRTRGVSDVRVALFVIVD